MFAQGCGGIESYSSHPGLRVWSSSVENPFHTVDDTQLRRLQQKQQIQAIPTAENRRHTADTQEAVWTGYISLNLKISRGSRT